jgi:hypothetical protein
MRDQITRVLSQGSTRCGSTLSARQAAVRLYSLHIMDSSATSTTGCPRESVHRVDSCSKEDVAGLEQAEEKMSTQFGPSLRTTLLRQARLLPLLSLLACDAMEPGVPYSQEDIARLERAQEQMSSSVPAERMEAIETALGHCALSDRYAPTHLEDRHTEAWVRVMEESMVLVADPENSIKTQARSLFICFWRKAADAQEVELMEYVARSEDPTYRATLILLRVDSEVFGPHPEREIAFRGLGIVDTDRLAVVNQLTPFLNDSAPTVVIATCQSLREVVNRHVISTGPSALAADVTLLAMEQLLAHPNESVRISAIVTIRDIAETHGSYGWFSAPAPIGLGQAVTVRKALDKARQDSDDVVRRLALEPLEYRSWPLFPGCAPVPPPTEPWNRGTAGAC